MTKLQKPSGFKKGDKVAIVSLSSGVLGEEFASHQLKLAKQRLKDFGLEPVVMPNALKGLEYLKGHPEARAQDLKEAFADETISGIICAIGGDDTYRLLPHLMEDEQFMQHVQNHPKIFSGFSDTTVNHLMFYRLGMGSLYGINILSDLAELADEMLPYTKQTFLNYFDGQELKSIPESEWWYEERTDFSADAVGTEKVRHAEKRGIEVVQGEGTVSGPLLGGCLESLYECLAGGRYPDQKETIQKYVIFPTIEEWKGKILFLETSEEKPTPNKLKHMLQALKEFGIFSVVRGVLIGKPQDEVYYEEYKQVYKEVIKDETLPILYNLPFGHAHPRTLLPYGIKVTMNIENQTVTFDESYFA